MGRIGRYLATVGTIVLTAVVGLKLARADYFPEPEKTQAWADYYSPNSPDLDPNDEVGVFVDSNDPNIGKICIGKYVVTDPNKYGFLHAYGNDSTTPEKDGADPNDPLEFRIWKDSEMKEHYADKDPCQVLFDPMGSPVNRVDVSKGERVPYGWLDLADFVSWWLVQDCNESNNHCGWWDTYKDGKIDFKDYADVAYNWNPEEAE